jgi:hypothetical protein
MWPGLTLGSVHEFVVGKVTLGHDFLLVLRFSSVSVTPQWLSMLIYHLGDEQ